MSIPLINGSLLLPQVAKLAVMSCLPSAVKRGILLQDLLLKIPSPVNHGCFHRCLQAISLVSRLAGLQGAAQQAYSVVTNLNLAEYVKPKSGTRSRVLDAMITTHL